MYDMTEPLDIVVVYDQYGWGIDEVMREANSIALRRADLAGWEDIEVVLISSVHMGDGAHKHEFEIWGTDHNDRASETDPLFPAEMFILERFLLCDDDVVTIVPSDKNNLRRSLLDRLHFEETKDKTLNVTLKENVRFKSSLKERFYLSKIVDLQNKLDKIRKSILEASE